MSFFQQCCLTKVLQVMSAKQSQESVLDQTNPKHVAQGSLRSCLPLGAFMVFEDDKSFQGASTFYVQAFCIGPGFYELGHSCFHDQKNDSTNPVKVKYIKFLTPGVLTLPTFTPFKTLLLLEHLHHKLVNSTNKSKVTRSSLDLIHFQSYYTPTATANHKACKKGKDGLHRNCIIIPKEEDCEVKDKNNKRRSEVP